ncbi:MAG: hypothetical protein IRZ13_18625, partial [Acetobacteraceae bacterium]|nr:hypothetical protein [Acetobacteraceae bacterium]
MKDRVNEAPLLPTPRPTAGRWLRAAVLVGGVPVAVLLLLLAGGWLAPGPGLLALAATLLGAGALARLWVRDLLRLAAALRRAAEAQEGAVTGSRPPRRLRPSRSRSRRRCCRPRATWPRAS